MNNQNETRILDEFPGITKKLEFHDSHWIKINQGGKREITERNAKDILDKDFPGCTAKHSLEDLKKELDEFYQQSIKDEAKKREELGWGYYANETEFIQDMNNRYKLFSVRASGSLKLLNGRSSLLSRLKVMANRYNRETSSDELAIANINDSLNVIVDDMAIQKREELKRKLRFDSSLSDPFDELLDAMRVTDHREIHKRALKHYVWQIKRKLWGCNPSYHFMLVLFTNKQAFGKTGFLRQFHKPLQEVFANITGDRIRDQFGADLFENYFVACFDELSQLAKADIAQLKEFVTRTEAVQRRMYSQVSQENRQNSTLCGTTNRPINQIIYDPSGMRRWWQIDLNSKDHERMDFDQLDEWEEQEFLKFWKSVDENNVNGYYGKKLPLYDEMVAYQDTFKAMSPVQQFVDEIGYTHDHTKRGSEHIESEEIELEKIWNEWVGWCKGTRNNPYSFLNFKNSLSELGFEIVEHRRVNKTTGQRNRVHYLVIDKVEDGSDL